MRGHPVLRPRSPPRPIAPEAAAAARAEAWAFQYFRAQDGRSRPATRGGGQVSTTQRRGDQGIEEVEPAEGHSKQQAASAAHRVGVHGPEFTARLKLRQQNMAQGERVCTAQSGILAVRSVNPHTIEMEQGRLCAEEMQCRALEQEVFAVAGGGLSQERRPGSAPATFHMSKARASKRTVAEVRARVAEATSQLEGDARGLWSEVEAGAPERVGEFLGHVEAGRRLLAGYGEAMIGQVEESCRRGGFPAYSWVGHATDAAVEPSTGAVLHLYTPRGALAERRRLRQWAQRLDVAKIAAADDSCAEVGGPEPHACRAAPPKRDAGALAPDGRARVARANVRRRRSIRTLVR